MLRQEGREACSDRCWLTFALDEHGNARVENRSFSAAAICIRATCSRRRRKLKQWSQRLPFRPLLRFLYIYVWQKGFLDGREGYYFARLHAVYEFLSVAKTYELMRTNAAPND